MQKNSRKLSNLFLVLCMVLTMVLGHSTLVSANAPLEIIELGNVPNGLPGEAITDEFEILTENYSGTPSFYWTDENGQSITDTTFVGGKTYILHIEMSAGNTTFTENFVYKINNIEYFPTRYSEDNTIAILELVYKIPNEDKIVVEINEETFPDDLFRDWILNGSHYTWDTSGNLIVVKYDANSDGKLSEVEITNVKQLLLQQMGISDLTGIEYFTSLVELQCQSNPITKLNVSTLSQLRVLLCTGCQLEGTLDLSHNPELTGVSCNKNRGLTEINISNCTKLNDIDFDNTSVKSIDLSNNLKLQGISCADSLISELDISNNKKLKNLYCYNIPLIGLDVSEHEELTILDCSANNMAWLNLGDKPVLDYLLNDSTIHLSVPASFDITEQFPGIDASKITIVSGGKISGNIISDYKEGTPVVYTYHCGTVANKEVLLTVTLNLDVKETTEPSNPSDKDNTNTGDVKVDSTSSALSKEHAPETGDTANIGLLLFVMITSGIVFLTIRKKMPFYS